MCTVTYLPLGTDQFILTSNRDEQPGRSPRSITVREAAGIELAFPPDQHSGGSWIAVSADNRVVCLLNGAFVKHHHQPPYKRSRGLMVMDFFHHSGAGDFFNTYDFEGMEPFTMVIYDRLDLFELRWDEQRTHITALDTAHPYIWASSTLYDEVSKRKRQQWFNDWLSRQNEFHQEAILDFHHHAGDGDPRNDVIMNRDGIVQTVSITSIFKSPTEISMNYEDLLRAEENQATIQLMHGYKKVD